MPEMSPEGDVRVLRAIAHPVRNRVLAELGAAGPLRAADVAARIGIPANQASFHLRQLAKYGLVEEAPELARDGRDRVWRPVREEGVKVELAVLEKSPGGKAAVGVFRRRMVARTKALVDSAFSDSQDEDVHVAVIDHALELTKEEATELADELDALNERWRLRTQGERSTDRRTYHLLEILQPYPGEDA